MRIVLILLSALLAFGTIAQLSVASDPVVRAAEGAAMSANGQCMDDCCANCSDMPYCKAMCGPAIVADGFEPMSLRLTQVHRTGPARSILSPANKPQPPPPRA